MDNWLWLHVFFLKNQNILNLKMFKSCRNGNLNFSSYLKFAFITNRGEEAKSQAPSQHELGQLQADGVAQQLVKAFFCVQ